MSRTGPVRRFPRTIRLTPARELQADTRGPEKPHLKTQSVPLLLLAAFALGIAIGTVLLCLPFASSDGTWTSLPIALFTATSAVCVTGLAPIDTADSWSTAGQVIILLLIQFGGLGFMTSATLMFLLFGWRVGLRERLLLSESMDLRMGGAVAIARGTIKFAMVAEAIGFVLLSLRFLFDYSPDRALWYGLFHSVSAFNNAGFDLFGGFRGLAAHDDVVTLSVVAVLAFLGSIGYPVIEDIRHRRRATLSLDTRLVLRTTFLIIAVSFVLIMLLEWNNTLAGRSLLDKAMHSAFQATASRTSGFSSLPTQELGDEVLLLSMAVMFIGGASGSTAGGIKVGTFAILLAATWSAVLGRNHVEAQGREIRGSDVNRALAIAMLATLLVFGFAVTLARLEDIELFRLLFETISAFGTTGLSAGATASLSDSGLLLMAVLMFIGRLGPLTLALALLQRRRPDRLRRPEERIRIG